jgi:hypothetical protein
MAYETKVVFYRNAKGMQKGIKKMEAAGWETVSTEAVS